VAMLALATDFSLTAEWLLSVLYVAIGLGTVIFIHELGHFAVAKWCGVKVERFSIGFGPVLLKVTRGETEYALSAIPFGGYVKMLGQDDADPGQLTDARIARDPRSYTSKTVLQRMAIISAGVFNNLVSAVLFFIIAFMMGVKYDPAIIGGVQPGGPGWKAGLRAGDQVTRVDHTEDPEMWFHHVRMAVALSDGPVEIGGYRPASVNGSGAKEAQRFDVSVLPEMKAEEDAMFPQIKIEPTLSLKFRNLPSTKSPVEAGSVASRATRAFQEGDVIVKVAKQPVTSFVQLQRILSDRRGEQVTITVDRKGELIDSKVDKTHFRTVGLQMDVGKIVAIQRGSPAEGKLKVGDKITHVSVDGVEQAVGDFLDPLELPDKGDSITETVLLTPEDRPGWLEKPSVEFADGPLSIPAIGVAYHVLHTVIKVSPKSEAAKAKIKPNDIVEELAFLSEEEGKTDQVNGKPIRFSPTERNWAQAFELMQAQAYKRVRIRIKDRKDAVVLNIQEAKNWYRPVRGLSLAPLQDTYRSKTAGLAVVKGGQYARDQILEMYLMLRRLASGKVSKRALGGPITIAQTAFLFAKKGTPDLILFLGILSVSLAVLNFLPVPVLDGGHFMFLLWEGIRGKPASVRVIETATYIGLALLLALMTWVMYLDIGRQIPQ
jgi:regulator of sigma E protease